jgi:hypothetical protein
MITLILLNYHIWINELKTIVKKARVWKFIDSNIDVEKSQSSESFIAADYLIIKKNDTARSAINLKELIAVQRKEYCWFISTVMIRSKSVYCMSVVYWLNGVRGFIAIWWVVYM